jgi:hypothetical protein
MSIHFKLNRDATTISISRHYYELNKRKTTTLATLDFTTDQIDIPNSLTEIEQKITRVWIKDQQKLIEKAYKMYSRLGYVGGTPVVSESGKYNSQFKDHPSCKLEAPAYSFLGCIKGARKLSLKVDAPSSIEMEEIIDNNQLATVAKSIIGAYCHKLISHPDLFADKIYSSDAVEQLIEANLLLSKFISAAKIKQGKVRSGGIDDRVERYFKELMATDEGYLIGKRLKISTLLNQKNNPKNNEDKDRYAPISEDERNELDQSDDFNQLYVEKPQTKTKKTSYNAQIMREKLDKIHGTTFGYAEGNNNNQ